ncbi:hypothetical protein BJ508DRAFT_334519 [Ascobolus immersus RN42]|uniref:Uncharacterized protein n=1 Tax=Ascobolus immersus RN42 TaxID=1160509 RepID=A0A3N4HJ61_ASCIM|nr:hypothetical protein BJ508DRAFT_334519 [Ascobolus immersus RN42]
MPSKNDIERGEYIRDNGFLLPYEMACRSCRNGRKRNKCIVVKFPYCTSSTKKAFVCANNTRSGHRSEWMMGEPRLYDLLSPLQKFIFVMGYKVTSNASCNETQFEHAKQTFAILSTDRKRKVCALPWVYHLKGSLEGVTSPVDWHSTQAPKDVEAFEKFIVDGILNRDDWRGIPIEEESANYKWNSSRQTSFSSSSDKKFLPAGHGGKNLVETMVLGFHASDQTSIKVEKGERPVGSPTLIDLTVDDTVNMDQVSFGAKPNAGYQPLQGTPRMKSTEGASLLTPTNNMLSLVQPSTLEDPNATRATKALVFEPDSSSEYESSRARKRRARSVLTPVQCHRGADGERITIESSEFTEATVDMKATNATTLVDSRQYKNTQAQDSMTPEATVATKATKASPSVVDPLQHKNTRAQDSLTPARDPRGADGERTSRHDVSPTKAILSPNTVPEGGSHVEAATKGTTDNKISTKAITRNVHICRDVATAIEVAGKFSKKDYLKLVTQLFPATMLSARHNCLYVLGAWRSVDDVVELFEYLKVTIEFSNCIRITMVAGEHVDWQILSRKVGLIAFVATWLLANREKEIESEPRYLSSNVFRTCKLADT